MPTTPKSTSNTAESDAGQSRLDEINDWINFLYEAKACYESGSGRTSDIAPSMLRDINQEIEWFKADKEYTGPKYISASGKEISKEAFDAELDRHYDSMKKGMQKIWDHKAPPLPPTYGSVTYPSQQEFNEIREKDRRENAAEIAEQNRLFQLQWYPQELAIEAARAVQPTKFEKWVHRFTSFASNMGYMSKGAAVDGELPQGAGTEPGWPVDIYGGLDAMSFVQTGNCFSRSNSTATITQAGYFPLMSEAFNYTRYPSEAPTTNITTASASQQSNSVLPVHPFQQPNDPAQPPSLVLNQSGKTGPVFDPNSRPIKSIGDVGPHVDFRASSSEGWYAIGVIPLSVLIELAIANPLIAGAIIVTATGAVVWDEYSSKKENTAIRRTDKYLFAPQASYLNSLKSLGQQFNNANTFAERVEKAHQIHALYNRGRFTASDSLENIDKRYHNEFKGKLSRSNFKIAEKQRNFIHTTYDYYYDSTKLYVLPDDEIKFLYENAVDKRKKEELLDQMLNRKLIPIESKQQPAVTVSTHSAELANSPEQGKSDASEPLSQGAEYTLTKTLTCVTAVVQVAEVIANAGFFLAREQQPIRVSATPLSNGCVVADHKSFSKW